MKCNFLKLIHNRKGRTALFVFTAVVLLAACQSGSHRQAAGNHSAGLVDTTHTREVDVEAVQLESGGWGYKIFVNHRLYIFQRQIPCVSGVRPFVSRSSALAVAAIVQSKLLKGEDPAVTIEELESVLRAELPAESDQGDR